MCPRLPQDGSTYGSWNLRGLTTSRSTSDAGLPTPAAIERILIDEGWMLEGFESVIGATLAMEQAEVDTCATSLLGCWEYPSL